MSDDASVYAAIARADTLSEASRTSIASTLRRISSLTGGQSVLAYTRFPRATMETVQRAGGPFAPATLLRMATAVCSTFRIVDAWRGKRARAWAEWQDLARELRVPVKESYGANEVQSERQASTMSALRWEDVLRAGSAYPRGSEERLLLLMYSAIPPKRRDFGKCWICFDGKGPRDPLAHDSYVVLPSRNRTCEGAELVVVRHKTAKTFGPLRDTLPAGLVREIRTSLEQRPRAYLFTANARGDPYKTDATFGDFANRTLRKALGCDTVCLTDLRHLFLGDTRAQSTAAEQLDNARRMGHSLTTSLRYDLRRDTVPRARTECVPRARPDGVFAPV
jgi:hypothetical protein